MIDRSYLLLPLTRKGRVLPFLASLVLLLSTLSHAEGIASTDTLVQQWLDVERQTVALESGWRDQKPLLKQRLTLLRAEKKQLSLLLEKKQSGQTGVEERRAALLVEQTQIEADQVKREATMLRIKQRLQGLMVLLPEPLLTQWQAQQSGLDGSVSNSSEQLQLLLAQLSDLLGFNSRISLHEAPLPNTDGQRVLVKQLYLGLGVAWFVSGDGSFAGLGYATPEGWHWHQSDEVSSSEITTAIAIYEKQREAAFVQLPLRLASAEEK